MIATAPAAIRRAPDAVTYAPRGEARALLACRDRECLIEGPAGTGKTFACLWKLHLAALKYPGMRALIVRKALVSLTASALVTFRQRVLDAGDFGVRFFGGSRDRPAAFLYPNGSVIVVGGMDKPTKIMSAEYDLAYCFVGDTRVTSPSPVEKAYSREYSGPLVTIRTASGNELTGTPNHPILTDQGWIALGLLREGSNVVSRRLVEDEGAGRNPDVDDEPTTIAEVARALALSPASRTERVEAVDMNFHGDGRGGNVDVVTAASFLHRRFDAALLEPTVELERREGDFEAEPLVGTGASGKMIIAVDGPRYSWPGRFAYCPEPLPVCGRRDPIPSGTGARSLEVRGPFGVGVSDVSLPGGVALRARGESSPPEFGFERRRADADGLRNLEQAAVSGEVALDRVVHVKRIDQPPGASRHVYNLQTLSHYYYANNIIAHNCNESTELTEIDWESLTTRLRYGVMPYQQLIGDSNPDAPTHWLNQRCERGVTTRFRTSHQDNPDLWDAETAIWTPRGADYIARLERLTGVRRLRLLDGKWVAAEGQVYDAWRPEVHVVSRAAVADLLADAWHFATVDWGWTNAGVIHVWAVDGDGRLILVAEHYQTRRTVDGWWIPRAVELQRHYAIREWVCDPSEPAYIEQFRQAGLDAKPAVNALLPGITAVQDRLAVQDDGRPRLMLLDDALVERDETLVAESLPWSTAQEVGAYVWAKNAGGQALKDRPVDAHNHGLDTLRYAVAWRDVRVQPEVWVY